MRSLTTWFVGLFTSPAGVLVLAALDSTVFFSLPFGIDAAVIILAAQLHVFAWIVPLLATAGSVIGAWLTFWLGAKIGEQGLERYVAPKRLARVHATIQSRGAVALAVLDLIPPPFPFTPFVLAAGALEVKTSTFFVTLTICRMFRFGLEAALAVIYGPRILSWLETDLVQNAVTVCILLALAFTTWSIVKIVRTSGRPGGRRVPV